MTCALHVNGGVNPITAFPLPACLVHIVAGYFSFTPEECACNWELMYLTPHAPIHAALTFNARLAPNCSSTDRNVLPFIADRYCSSTLFWKYAGNVYEKLLPLHLDVAKVFQTHVRIFLTRDILRIVSQQSNDEVMWWLASLDDVVSFESLQFYNYSGPILRKIVTWKSHRLVRYINNQGWLDETRTACFF